MMVFDRVSKDRRSMSCDRPIPEDSCLGRVESVKTMSKHTHVSVVIDYYLGGTNWLTHAYNPRGYRVCVHPVELRDNCVCRSLGGEFIESGGYVMLAPAKAFSAKHMAAWVDKAEPHVAEIVRAFCAGDQDATVAAMEAIGRTV